MSSTRIARLFAAGLVAPLLLASVAVGAAEVCPLRDGEGARYVDVFDGPPEDLATLIPETTSKTRGYWPLAYVYEAGRTVTIRCKYAKGDPVDVKFPQKIKRCDYKVERKGALSLTCK